MIKTVSRYYISLVSQSGQLLLTLREVFITNHRFLTASQLRHDTAVAQYGIHWGLLYYLLQVILWCCKYLGYIVNGTMTDKLEKIWKEAGMA